MERRKGEEMKAVEFWEKARQFYRLKWPHCKCNLHETRSSEVAIFVCTEHRLDETITPEDLKGFEAPEPVDDKGWTRRERRQQAKVDAYHQRQIERGMNARQLLEHRMKEGSEVHKEFARQMGGIPIREQDPDRFVHGLIEDKTTKLDPKPIYTGIFSPGEENPLRKEKSPQEDARKRYNSGGLLGIDLQKFEYTAGIGKDSIELQMNLGVQVYCSKKTPIRYCGLEFTEGFRINADEKWQFGFRHTARHGSHWLAIRVKEGNTVEFVGEGVTITDAHSSHPIEIDISGVGPIKDGESKTFRGVDRTEHIPGKVYPVSEQTMRRIEKEGLSPFAPIEECRPEDGKPISKLDDVPDYSPHVTIYCQNDEDI